MRIWLAIVITTGTVGCLAHEEQRHPDAPLVHRAPVGLNFKNSSTGCSTGFTITRDGCILSGESQSSTHEDGKTVMNFSEARPEGLWCNQKVEVCGVEFTCVCKDNQ